MATIKTNSVTAYDVTTQFELSWTETVNPKTNTSELALTLTTIQQPTGSGYKRTIRSSGSYVSINGTQYAISDNSVSNGTVLWSRTINITHDDDGEKTVAAAIRVNVGGDYVSGSGQIVLTGINRQGATISLKTASKTHQSVTIQITADQDCDAGSYRLNNGSWNDFSTTGTDVNKEGGGTIMKELTGLSSETSYKIDVKLRREYNQVYSDIATIVVSTLADQLKVPYNDNGTLKTARVWYHSSSGVKKVKELYYNDNGIIKK